MSSAPSPFPFATAAPAPASDAAGWISLDEAAQRTGKSVGHLRRLCGEQWLAQNKARLVRSGQRQVWQVRGVACLEMAQGSPAAASGLPTGQTVDDLRALPAEARQKALERKQILDQWEEAVTAGGKLGFSRDQTTAQFLQRLHVTANLELSRATLYNWAKAFARQGLIGLVDGRTRSEAAPTQDDPFLAEIRRLWLTPREMKLSVCYEIALVMAEERGWSTCSYRTAARHVQSLDRAVVLKLRGGEKDYVDDAEPYIERDYSGLATNDMWVADHHSFDVLVRVPGSKDGAVARPWLTAWMDMRSRKIVGLLIRLADPNTDAVLETLRRAIVANGVPGSAYTDNGKDFDCQVLTGQTKTMRWARRRVRVEIDGTRVGGVYAGLGIKHLHALPYHGQSKPIERWFRTVEDRFGRVWPTYCGKDTLSKPEDLYDQVRKGKAPTLEAFTEAFTAWVEVDYHQREHAGDGLDGQTPAQVFEAQLGTLRTAPAQLLEVLLQRRVGPVRVTQNGVRWNGLTYGQHLPELRKLLGKSVWLRIDDRDVTQVSVWTAEDQLVGVAPANKRLPVQASAEDLRQAMAQKRQHRRAVQAAKQVGLRVAEDLPERMIRAAAERNRAAQEANPTTTTDATPPSMQPVRSAIESSLEQLSQARKAAGAENVSSRMEISNQQQQRIVPDLSGLGAMIERGSSVESEEGFEGRSTVDQQPIWNRLQWGESSDE